MSKVILIKNKEELTQIITGNENVVVDFFAQWCGPCKMLLPVLDQVSTELDDVIICKVNVDENSEIAAENNIRSIPTVIFYKNGNNVGNNMGFLPKQQFTETLKKNLNLK